MTDPSKPAAGPSAKGREAIPLYALYGEDIAVDEAAFIHIESVAARSSLYDWEIDSHTHQGLFQTVVMLEGACQVHLDDSVVSVRAPAAVTIPPAIVHAFVFEPGTVGHVLTISEAMLFAAVSRRGRVLFDALLAEPRAIELTDPHAVTRMAVLLDQLLDEFHATRRGHNSLCEWLAKSVFLMIERELASHLMDTHAPRGRAELFTRFRALVERRFLDHWTVPDYADALGVTASKLNRLCKTMTGRTAFEITQDRLLLEAKRRLVYIAAPVQSLAFELGFEDPGYFNRFFKKHTGQTPGGFRREQQSKLA